MTSTLLAVGDVTDLRTIGVSGMTVMTGLIDTHTHASLGWSR